MALTTHNITGSLKDALGGTGLVGEVTFTPFGTHDARVDGADALLGPIRYSITDLPASLPLSAGGWVISIRSTGRVNGDQQFKTITRTLDLVGPLTWGEIVAGAVSSPPMTPTLVEEAQAAADEAEMWASTAQGVQDTAVETLVNDPASATSGALSATYVTLATEALYAVDRYGDIEEATLVTDAAMTAGSAVLHSDSHAFTQADVGMTVGVRGAGTVSTNYDTLANDGVLVTTIASVSGGDATLSTPAVTTCSGVRAVFGFPIDAAFAAAAAAASQLGGTVYIPAGRWITTVKASIGTGAGVAGAGRARSIVHYVKTGDGTSGSTAPWLGLSGASDPEDGKRHEINIRDFTVDGQFFVATTGYASTMKLIFVSGTADSSIRNMAILNCPATAIGYDESIRCIIEGNTIINSGRLAQITNVISGSSGSGIGIAVTDASEGSTCVIRDNFISAGWGASGGTGRHGINLEGVYTADGVPMYGTYIIQGNVIENCYLGIRDTGALASNISGNTISGCQIGIHLGQKGSSGSRMPVHTIVQGNVIRDLVAAPVFGADGALDAYGINIDSSSLTYPDSGRILVLGNSLANIPGQGIHIEGAGHSIDHLRVEANTIHDCASEGIKVEGTLRDLSVINNSVSGCGWGGVHDEAISLDATVVLTDGRIEGNDLTDYAATPTQDSRVYVASGASLTRVSLRRNTGDVADNSYKTKGSTSTITNTTALATLSNFTVALKANTVYHFEALLEFTATTGAGAKFGLLLPSGATAYWSASGPGAPTGRLSQTSSAAFAGNTGATSIAASLSGWVHVGSAGGNFGFTAAQSVAEASDLVVTTASRLAVFTMSAA